MFLCWCWLFACLVCGVVLCNSSVISAMSLSIRCLHIGAYLFLVVTGGLLGVVLLFLVFYSVFAWKCLPFVVWVVVVGWKIVQ